MAETTWIKMPVFLVLGLQFTGALSSRPSSSVTVKAEDGVTLPCEHVVGGQHHCDSTTWLFSSPRSKGTVELVNLGKIGQKAKSGGLRVAAGCSLGIEKVRGQDVGLYTCRQFIQGQQQGADSQVELSVVSMTEGLIDGQATLNCSVLTHEACRHTVKWMKNTGSGWEVWSGTTRSTTITQSTCSGVASFPTSSPFYSPNYESLTCSVTDDLSGREHRCSFKLQSCEKSGKNTKPTTTKPTTTKPTTTKPTTTKPTTTKPTTTKPTPSATVSSAAGDSSEPQQGWWWVYVAVALVVVGLLIVAVIVLRSKRPKGNKARANDDTADPEDGVCYASVSYAKKTKGKAKVRSKNNNEEGDATTYATVKASSTVQADPEDGVCYASVRYAKKTKGKAKVGSKNNNEEGDATTYATVKASSTVQADPEDGVCYASVRYAKKTKGKAKVGSKNNNEEGDATTYATVKVSSADPGSLYPAVK